MTDLVPNRFLFSFEFPLHYRAQPPHITGELSDWTDAELLPALGELDRRPEFARVWACWNDDGLCIATRVDGKCRPLRCETDSFWTGDNFRLCTDMRDTRDIKRADRFCQQFYFLPTGGGAKRRDAAAGVSKLQRAREDAPRIPAEKIVVASKVSAKGYTLEAHIPAECLSGFDPSEHPRIGLYYILEDTDHGQQHLTIGDDLNWHVDPSTWATAVLAR
jgi:hypothetical protein